VKMMNGEPLSEVRKTYLLCWQILL
jgi:hypothetical protein